MHPYVIMLPVDGGPDGHHTQIAAEEWLTERVGPQLDGWDCWKDDEEPNMMVFYVYADEKTLVDFSNTFTNMGQMMNGRRFRSKIAKAFHFSVSSLRTVADYKMIDWLKEHAVRNIEWWTSPERRINRTGMVFHIRDDDLATMFRLTFAGKAFPDPNWTET